MCLSDSKCGTFSRLRPLGPPAPVLRGKDNGTRGLSCLDTRLGLRLLRQRCRQRGADVHNLVAQRIISAPRRVGIHELGLT